MRKISEIFTVWKRVFGTWKYGFLSIVVALIFYFFNGLLYNISNIASFYHLFGLGEALRILFVLSFGFVRQITPFSLWSIIVLSILVGTFVSLLTYRYSIVKYPQVKQLGLLGGAGMFLGVVAPGCAACGLGILGFLGFSSILVALPFRGNEIIVIAMVLLVISIFTLSARLYKPLCSLKVERRIKK